MCGGKAAKSASPIPLSDLLFKLNDNFEMETKGKAATEPSCLA
jgi:hypothetical protein